mgnify:CR=1 FL=1
MRNDAIPLFPAFFSIVLMSAATFLSLPLRAAGPAETLATIESLVGLKATHYPAESVYKVTKPRTDIAVRVDRWPLPPFMGLTTWAAFGPGGRSDVMLTGDLVVFEDEVNPVMSVLLDGGVQVTALHNHFFFDQPKVYFMHIGGEGTIAALAPVVRAALAKIDDIRRARPIPGSDFGGVPPPSRNSIAGAAIEASLGFKGEARDGMFKVVVGRSTTMDCGCRAGKEMGVNTWAAFAGSDDAALVDGDFAVLESELQSVLKALRRGGINIVSIHNHMTGEIPRILFLHYWGRGSTADLAATLRSALDTQQPD